MCERGPWFKIVVIPEMIFAGLGKIILGQVIQFGILGSCRRLIVGLCRCLTGFSLGFSEVVGVSLSAFVGAYGLGS